MRRRPWLFAAIVVTVLPGLCLVVFGLDWPVGSGKTGCDDCHNINHTALGPSLLNAASINNLCLSCHNTTQGGYGAVTTHRSLPCTNCHDPHDDQGANLQHVPTSVATTLSVNPSAVVFTDNSSSSGNFADGASPYNGICEVCHSATKYYRYNGPGPSWPHTSQGTDKKCTNCHFHNTGFAASGDNCVACHDKAQGGGTYAAGTKRRPVVGTSGDFAGATRLGGHVQSGSDPTNFECVVCHAEGYVDTSVSPVAVKANTNYHMDTGKLVHLYNVDSHSGTSATANPTWSNLFTVKADATNWPGTSNAYKQALTNFCVQCHDSDGATTNFTQRPSAGGSAANPFADTKSPLNIVTKFLVANYSTHALRSGAGGKTGLGAKYSNNFPTDSSAINGNAFVSPWTSASTLECADCHMGTEDLATPTYYHNAHGSKGLKWLLIDKNGKDRSYGTRTYESSSSTVICYACHAPNTYSGDGAKVQEAYSRFPAHNQKGNHHDPSGSDGNTYGIGCLNCHGGYSPGGIHGSNDQITDDGSLGTYNALRFTNGASLDYFNSASGQNGSTCSVESSATNPPNLGCTQHSSKNYTRQY